MPGVRLVHISVKGHCTLPLKQKLIYSLEADPIASQLHLGNMLFHVSVLLIYLLGAAGESCDTGQLKAEIEDISFTEYRVRYFLRH